MTGNETGPSWIKSSREDRQENTTTTRNIPSTATAAILCTVLVVFAPVASSATATATASTNTTISQSGTYYIRTGFFNALEDHRFDGPVKPDKGGGYEWEDWYLMFHVAIPADSQVTSAIVTWSHQDTHAVVAPEKDFRCGGTPWCDDSAVYFDPLATRFFVNGATSGGLYSWLPLPPPSGSSGSVDLLQRPGIIERLKTSGAVALWGNTQLSLPDSQAHVSPGFNGETWRSVAATYTANISGTLTVNYTVPPPCITFTAVSTSETLNAGVSAKLVVTAEGRNEPLHYQWFEGVGGDISKPVSGATDPVFFTPRLERTTGYWARVSSACGSLDTPTATIVIGEQGTLAEITNATARSSTWISVSAPFQGDANQNGYRHCEIRRSTTQTFTTNGSTAPYLAGSSEWSETYFVVAPNTTYFLRCIYVDPDGVIGSHEQLIGPITTPRTGRDAVTVEPAVATVEKTEILVTVPIRDDANRNSSGHIEIATSLSGPWTTRVAALPFYPKQGRIRSLTPNTTYYVRVTITDPDGINGSDVQILGPIRYTGLQNLALGKPITADAAWGCCTNTAELVDGLIQAADWMSPSTSSAV